jgi:hypothetical protein
MIRGDRSVQFLDYSRDYIALGIYVARGSNDNAEDLSLTGHKVK